MNDVPLFWVTAPAQLQLDLVLVDRWSDARRLFCSKIDLFTIIPRAHTNIVSRFGMHKAVQMYVNFLQEIYTDIDEESIPVRPSLLKRLRILHIRPISTL